LCSVFEPATQQEVFDHVAGKTTVFLRHCLK
jgi:hypothetical protein